MRSYVGAPIRVGGATVGFLNVDGTRPGQFGPADARRLKAFANHAATAVENAHLYQQLRNYAGQLEQRVRERTAQLAAQYAHLEAILRSTPDGIVVVDEEGEVLQSNPVARAWLAQTLSPGEVERLQKALRDLAAQAEERPEVVLELTGLDLELRAAPILATGEMEEGLALPPQSRGEPTAVVALHDISHLKALDRMKTRFITNVSHELRTPVTTIKLYAELMQRKPEQWREYLVPLMQEADHQVHLVEDILQIARIDAGRMELRPRPLPLNEFTGMILVGHQMLAQKYGLTLEHHPADPEPVALADSKWLMQALNHLLENAIYYTPEGGIVGIFTGRSEAEGRVWATVTVADTGIGVPEEELPHIFERFFRGAEPRLRQISGTGLGLAIAQDIVELHGGRITVESPSTALGMGMGDGGAGSAFTVWLPLGGSGGGR